MFIKVIQISEISNTMSQRKFVEAAEAAVNLVSTPKKKKIQLQTKYERCIICQNKEGKTICSDINKVSPKCFEL